jgi:Small-conductance mechanosensitive channel
MTLDIEALLKQAPELIVTYGIKIVLAIVIYIVGKWLAGLLSKLLEKGMNARNIDPTICNFTKNITYYVLVALVVITVLGQIGVQTASFVAVVGAAGLAVGLALQGSLANFAAGVLLVLFRPLKIGDYVEAGGTSGTVKEISIFCTIMTTPDNKTVIVPNSGIMGGNIINYSTQEKRRVDFIVGVAYSANLDTVRKELQAIASEDERILQDHDVTIGVAALADSSVNFAFRVWVNSANYWGVFFETNEKIKKRFDAQGIQIPFPQMDVHIAKE